MVALGASVLRSLAVSTAAGVFSDDAGSMPDGFWRHSVSVAAGASIAARTTSSITAGDAMCAGLLHDLGAALLFRIDREGYGARLAPGGDPATLASEEAAAYGGDHAVIGADALDAWKLPVTIIDALRRHHQRPPDVGDELALVVIAGEGLARAAFEDPPFAHEPAADPGEAFAALGLRAVPVERLISRTAEETETLDGLLAVR